MLRHRIRASVDAAPEFRALRWLKHLRQVRLRIYGLASCDVRRILTRGWSLCQNRPNELCLLSDQRVLIEREPRGVACLCEQCGPWVIMQRSEANLVLRGVVLVEEMQEAWEALEPHGAI